LPAIPRSEARLPVTSIAPPARGHFGHDVGDRPERRFQVHAQHHVERIVAISFDRGKGAAGSGVEEQCVDRPVQRGRPIERGDQLRLVTHIGSGPLCGITQRSARGLQQFRPPGDQRNPAAQRHDPIRRCPTDPGRRAGDNDMAVREVHRCCP
jgi:hypothetical protein